MCAIIGVLIYRIFLFYFVNVQTWFVFIILFFPFLIILGVCPHCVSGTLGGILHQHGS